MVVRAYKTSEQNQSRQPSSGKGSRIIQEKSTKLLSSRFLYKKKTDLDLKKKKKKEKKEKRGKMGIGYNYGWACVLCLSRLWSKIFLLVRSYVCVQKTVASNR